MKRALWTAALLAGAMAVATWAPGTRAEDVQRVPVPAANDPRAYVPQPAPKPLPSESTGLPQPGQPGQPQPPMAPPPPPGGAMGRPDGLPSEEPFVKAYAAHRNPRIMVFVNRTIHGDSLSPDGLAEVMRTEEKHVATGAVNVTSDHVATSQSSNAGSSVGPGGASAGAGQASSNESAKTGFTSGGPADYTKTTSVKVATDKYDEIGATKDDYEMIELSIINYMDAGGRVQIKDSDAARAKLDREKVLRLENGDPRAVRLLSTELQTDILIQVKAVPTRHSQWGQAVRLLVKAVGTTDARNLGSVFVDMPLPITKTNVNIFTRFLADKMMQQMADKWSGNPEWDPVEVRIYKAASVDDSMKIRKFLQAVKGVQSVQTRGATGGTTTSYATLAVAYIGAPEDLYADLKECIGQSTGLKAVDLQNNTINLEVTGPMNLVTTTKTTDVKTTTETTTTEVKTVDPIRPAPPAPGN